MKRVMTKPFLSYNDCVHSFRFLWHSNEKRLEHILLYSGNRHSIVYLLFVAVSGIAAPESKNWKGKTWLWCNHIFRILSWYFGGDALISETSILFNCHFLYFTVITIFIILNTTMKKFSNMEQINYLISWV